MWGQCTGAVRSVRNGSGVMELAHVRRLCVRSSLKGTPQSSRLLLRLESVGAVEPLLSPGVPR